MKLRTFVIAIFVFTGTSSFNPAFAKQCIWNKGGFILNITWIKDGKIARKDQIALGQGNCSDDRGYTVALSIAGGKLADLITRGAIVGAASALGVAGLEATAGASVPLATTIGYLASAGIPDPKQIFYVGVPSSDRYLDVWGTIWNPRTGPGGKI